ncbi:MAG: penicillin acylase family protein, partial [Bacteroidota bacterium]
RDLVDTDKFFLALGIDEASQRTVTEVDQDSEAIQLCEAYLEGVNQFVGEGPTPIEFYLTGLDKSPFTLRDVYNTIGYMAFSFAMAHKTDPLLTNIHNKLGPEYLKDLGITVNADQLKIKSYAQQVPDSLQNTISATVSQVLGKIDLPLFQGSNSWVLAPEKTKNGKVILANDPHIGFAQPAVWYEAHVVTPTYEKYGYHMAGIPFPILGHDRNLAYGMTMFQNDDTDFYFEESDGSRYRKNGEWAPYESVQKTIKVKDSSDITFTLKKTHRGALLNGIMDQITGERPVSISWIYPQLRNRVMDALYGMTHATNIIEFQQALPHIHAPGLNIMYGDAEDNVAWWAAARIYRVPDSINSKMIFEPGQGLPLEKEFLPFKDNPHAINPPWQYVYSANNQPDSVAGMLYPGYYLPENRAKRIVQLLDAKSDWDRHQVSQMTLDVTSSVNQQIAANLIKSLDLNQLEKPQIEALELLSTWKGDYPLNSTAGTLYTRWIQFFLEKTFADELGDALYKQFLVTHFHKRRIAAMTTTTDSPWWDNRNTQNVVEYKTDIVQESFMAALESLQSDFGPDMDSWTWDKVHTLEHGHPIGQVEALRPFFNVGPFPVSGSRETINNMYFSFGERVVYPVTSGPSTRRVIDFSDIENSISILPTGQSGNPLSPHYKDQAQMYVNGEFRKMMMNKEEIIQTSKSLLTFRPTDP